MDVSHRPNNHQIVFGNILGKILILFCVIFVNTLECERHLRPVIPVYIFSSNSIHGHAYVYIEHLISPSSLFSSFFYSFHRTCIHLSKKLISNAIDSIKQADIVSRINYFSYVNSYSNHENHFQAANFDRRVRCRLFVCKQSVDSSPKHPKPETKKFSDFFATKIGPPCITSASKCRQIISQCEEDECRVPATNFDRSQIRVYETDTIAEGSTRQHRGRHFLGRHRPQQHGRLLDCNRLIFTLSHHGAGLHFEGENRRSPVGRP